ncbi:MAG: DNA polymerase IV [Dehalococcoidia bacterium]|nr:DNA polymerase IV [Dehalococcoidia bacterium]
MTEIVKRPARTIFHIDLDAFFVTVEQVLDPSLHNKPVIVGGRPQGRGVVASASYECRKFGVHAAMPLTKAKQLCPQAIFLTGNYRRYSEFSHKFMTILADYSPCIESGGLDEAYLDVTGCENFGSWRSLALKIKERVKKETGLIASVGIAPCKVVAKIASDLSKPDGLIEVLPGGEQDFLASLAVRKLPGVGEKTAVLMKSAGIETIGQLAAMRPELFKRRFGEGMLWLQQYARGIDNSAVENRGEAKSISRETTFEKDTGDTSFLRATLRYFAEKIGADLRESDKKARTVTLKLRYSDFETVNRSSTSREAMNLDDLIFQSAAGLLEKTLGKKFKPVRLIGLEVSNLVAGETQLNLFNAEARRLEKVDRAVDYIRDKYGFDAIQTGYTLELKQKYDGKTGDK